MVWLWFGYGLVMVWLWFGYGLVFKLKTKSEKCKTKNNLTAFFKNQKLKNKN